MTVPERISIVTLGVRDVARSAAFYGALGWERTMPVDGREMRLQSATRRTRPSGV